VKNETGVKQFDIAAGFRFDVDGRKLRTEQLQDGMKLNATFITTTTGTAPVVAEKKTKKLPKTASPVPLAGLAGALSLASGFALRRRSR
jgi:LPXTG-motif cell wall-anchored protein